MFKVEAQIARYNSYHLGRGGYLLNITNLDQMLTMLNYTKRPKIQERQELTDFRRQECFIRSLACLQSIHPLTVLWQHPDGLLLAIRNTLASSAGVPLQARNAGWESCYENKLPDLSSRDREKEQSRGVITMHVGMETGPLAVVNQSVVPRNEEDQTARIRYDLVITRTKAFWLGKAVCVKLPRESQHLPLNF